MGWIEQSLDATIELARATVELGRAEAVDAAVPALAALAFLQFLAGELGESRVLAEEVLARPEVGARPHGLVMALAVLALVDAESGRTDPAVARAREAVSTARDAGVAEVSVSGGLAHTALGAALAAHDGLREAEREAAHGEKLRWCAEPEAGHLHALLVLAGIRARRGQLDRAAADLELVRHGLESFADAGRLPALADEVGKLVDQGTAEAGPGGEQPSAAELSVLRLLATDLSQREIGAELFLSLNTVKTHTRSLYRKLGVASREEAVARATALGLLDGDSPG